MFWGNRVRGRAYINVRGGPCAEVIGRDLDREPCGPRHHLTAMLLIRRVPRAPLAFNLRSRQIHSSVRAMSAPDAFLVPIDPAAPASSAVANLPDLWASARPKDKAGETRVFFNVDGKGSIAAAVSLGPKSAGKSEPVRKAIGTGLKKLRDVGATTVLIDTKDQLHAAGKHLFK